MEVVKRLTKQQLTEFSALFGPPPVLSSENDENYEAMCNHLMDCLGPVDFLEVLLIKTVLNESWKLIRYYRHQAVGTERRFRQSLAFQGERRRELTARREALARELAEKTGRPLTDFDKLVHLEEVVSSVVDDVDRILDRGATETQHNQALADGIAFQEQLDRLITAAIARRNDALETLELYRNGLGQTWRRISDEVIEGSVLEISGPEKQVEAPPVAPESAEASTAPENTGSSN